MTLEQPSGPFEQKAAEHWDLKRLYADLAVAKAAAVPKRNPTLTKSEKERLCGLLLNYSPAEIAEQQYVVNGTVEVSFSTGLYRYVEILTGRDRNILESWREVADWLEDAGYRRTMVAINWAHMPQVPALHGRQPDVDRLSSWILGTAPCQLLAINGPAGVGKTSLVIELARKIKPQFEGAIWQSLRHKPSLENVLSGWLRQLPAEATQVTDDTEWYGKIDGLMNYLRSHRCLVVMDNLEAILSSGSLFGEYEKGYEAYRELLKRMGEEPHQSCVLVTSREGNQETRGSSSVTNPIRSVYLNGLGYEAAEQILKEAKLNLGEGTQTYGKSLVQMYRGNPYMLRMAASMIHDVFDGKVGSFLKQPTTLFGEATYMLAQQCDRLSVGEKAILAQLANQDDQVPLTDLIPPHQLESLTALHRRSLIERSAAGYTLRPVVMEYVRRQLALDTW